MGSTSATQHRWAKQITWLRVVWALMIIAVLGMAFTAFGSYQTGEIVSQEGSAVEAVEGDAFGGGGKVTVHLAVPGSEIQAVHLVDPDGVIVARETNLAGASAVYFPAIEISPEETWSVVVIGNDGEIMARAEFVIHHHWPWEGGLP